MKYFNNWIIPKFKDGFKKIKENSIFEIEFSNDITLSSSNHFDALFYNARMIAELYPQPFDVFLSGGIDSEIIVRVNKKLGIKQNIIIVKLDHDLNIRDVNESVNICKELKIPYKIINFNLKKYFENDAESDYKNTFCNKVEYLPRLSWHKFSDNTLIMGGGEPYWRRELESNYDKKSKWHLYLKEEDFSLTLFNPTLRLDIIGEWYCFTPDITFTFHKTKLISDLIDDKIIGKISTYSSRIPLYKEIFPTIKTKPKLVGYEGSGAPGDKPDYMKNFENEIMKNNKSSHYVLSKQDLNNLIL